MDLSALPLIRKVTTISPLQGKVKLIISQVLPVITCKTRSESLWIYSSGFVTLSTVFKWLVTSVCREGLAGDILGDYKTTIITTNGLRMCCKIPNTQRWKICVGFKN
jgi:hypothetical protein